MNKNFPNVMETISLQIQENDKPQLEETNKNHTKTHHNKPAENEKITKQTGEKRMTIDFISRE